MSNYCSDSVARKQEQILLATSLDLITMLHAARFLYLLGARVSPPKYRDRARG